MEANDPDPATAAAIAAALNDPPTTRATRSSKRTATEAHLPTRRTSASSIEETPAETNKKVKSQHTSTKEEEYEGQRPKGMCVTAFFVRWRMPCL